MPRHAQGNLSFDVPRHWEDKTIVAFSAPSRPGQSTSASFVMTRDTLTDSDTLASYADRQLAELSQRVDGFELVDKRESPVAGSRAFSLRFNSKALAGPLVQRLVVIEDRRRAVVCLTATAPRADAAQLDPLFDRMLASVRFTQPEGDPGEDAAWPPVFPAAKKGDRVSHNAAASHRTSDTVIAALLGQSLTVRGTAGALAARLGASASCAVTRASLSITELVPHSTTGTIEGASPTVFVAPGLGAALAEADPVDCHHHNDKPIAPGTTTVLVQGLGLARTGGETGCGAVICDGAPTVLAGGPAGSGAGAGTPGGSPNTDAIAYAEALAGHLGAAAASAQRGAALIEQRVEETVARTEGAVSGALSAMAGAFTSITRGGTLGALTGAPLASG